MITGAFAIFFTGYTHIWALYQPYVIAQTGWTPAQASMGFYMSNCIFVIGNILGGRLESKIGSRLVIASGGGIFTAGILLSSFFLGGSPIPLCLTYGAMQGLGQGMLYAVILSTAQRWFPERTGFASGVIVTSNGLCGFILSPISRALLEKGGPVLALRSVGIAIGISWLLVSVFLTVPPSDSGHMDIEKKGTDVPIGRQYTSKEMIHTRKFYYLLGTMMFGLIPYYLLSPISQSLQMEYGISAEIAVAAVMAGSLLNAATRLLLPTLADRIGRIRCLRAIQMLSVVAMLMLTWSHSYAITIAVVLMYICYGGIMGNFPALTSSIFGIEHSAENYGCVMIGMIAASLGAPMISSIIATLGFGNNVMFGTGMALSLLSLILLSFLREEK